MAVISSVGRCFLLALLLPLLCLSLPLRACDPPQFSFCNTSLSFDQRVDLLVAVLTQEEKISLLTARVARAVPRLGLPQYDFGLNAVHGVETNCPSGVCPTSFPIASCMACSFNDSVVQNMAAIMGIEARALYLAGATEANHPTIKIGLDAWSPNINLVRDPRWGRAMESPGEDPLLLGNFGKAYTNGMQRGSDPKYLLAVTTLKHWAAYSLENYNGVTRHNYNAVISAYDWNETYSKAFQSTIEGSEPAGIMTSYNSVNGVPSSANRKLRALLESWGFDGYTTSDSGAIEDIYKADSHGYVATAAEAVAVALAAHCDIDSGPVFQNHLAEALRLNLTTIDFVDRAVRSSLLMRFRLGLFDPIENQVYWKYTLDQVGSAASKRASLEATLQGLVLLENKESLLPLKNGLNVAVVGWHANSTQSLLGNYNGFVCPTGRFDCMHSIYSAMANRNSEGQTRLAIGCDSVFCNNTGGFSAAISAAKESDVVIAALGLDLSIEAEGLDRHTITLPAGQLELLAQLQATGKPVVLVLVNGGALALESISTEAIIEAHYPGVYGGTALSQAIFGDANRWGKLATTFYSEAQILEFDFLSMDMKRRTYRYFPDEPVYPFGYGLSYTTFSTKWSSDSVAIVTNTGQVAGDEVVFQYARNPVPPLLKELVAYKRVSLKAGASQVIQF